MFLYKCVNNKIPSLSHGHKYVSKKIIRIRKTPQKTLDCEKHEEDISSRNEDQNKSCSDTSDMDDRRINLQMLPDNLYRQIFGDDPRTQHTSQEMKGIRQELEKFGCDVDTASQLPNIDLSIPKLEGSNLEEHFFNIASAQIRPYIRLP